MDALASFRSSVTTAPASVKASTVGALPAAFPTGMWGMRILHGVKICPCSRAHAPYLYPCRQCRNNAFIHIAFYINYFQRGCESSLSKRCLLEFMSFCQSASLLIKEALSNIISSDFWVEPVLTLNRLPI